MDSMVLFLLLGLGSMPIVNGNVLVIDKSSYFCPHDGRAVWIPQTMTLFQVFQQPLLETFPRMLAIPFY
jgi:hypothetical protein